MTRHKANQQLFDSIVSVGFYCNGNPCNAYTIFEKAYSGLDNLIELNRKEQRKSFQTGYVQPADLDERRERDYFRWLESVPESLEMKAQLRTKKTPKFVDLKIKPRTNFTADKDRRPNIVYAEDDNQNTLIMRLSRTYLPGKRKGSHNFNWLRRNHYKKIDIDNLMEWIEKENLSKNKYHSYQYLPEPHLIVALENMYKEGFPRVTPKLKTVDQKDNELVTLRPMLMRAWDMPLTQELQKQLGEYLGNLYSLGIIEKADRNIAHYSIQKPMPEYAPRVVNFDPDFFVRANFPKAAQNQIIKEDFNEFANTLYKYGKKEELIIPSGVINNIYEYSMKQKNSSINKYFKKNFLEFLPENIEKATFPNPLK
ncbi:MAG: hypothetical protein ACQESF_07025 [Nanobdellota archaeon]